MLTYAITSTVNNCFFNGNGGILVTKNQVKFAAGTTLLAFIATILCSYLAMRNLPHTDPHNYWLNAISVGVIGISLFVTNLQARLLLAFGAVVTIFAAILAQYVFLILL